MSDSHHRKEWFRFDLVAGLTTAAVIIPKAMGTSRLLSVTTSSTIAVLTFSGRG